jgi:chromosomal replication initiator protein
VPNLFAKDWIASKHHKTILKHLRELSDMVRAVEYSISTKAPEDSPLPIASEQGGLGAPFGELPLKDLYINKIDNLNPRYVFDSFVVGSFNELAFAAAQSILERPGTRYNPFFVYGQTGHGKTHLIQALGNEINGDFPTKKSIT